MLFPSHLGRRTRWLFVSLFTCLIAIGWGTISHAQIPLLGDSDSVETGLPPADVIRYGALEVTWVQSPVSGEDLFQIAAPTVADRSDLSGGAIAVESRADIVEDLLWLETTRFREDAIARLLNRDTAKAPRSAQVVISTLKTLPVIQISNSANSRPLTIITVTQEDTEFYSETPEQLAAQWQETLQAEILQIEAIYSPQSFRQRIQQTLGTVLGVLFLTGILGFLRWRLGKRQRALQSKHKAEVEAAAATQSALDQQKVESAPAGVPSQNESRVKPTASSEKSDHEAFAYSLRRHLKVQLSLSRRLDIYKFLCWLLLWAIVVVWYLGVYLSTTQLPILMRWSTSVLTQPLSLIVIWFVISLMMRVSDFLIQRSLNAWQQNAYLSFGDTRRKAVRSQTIIGALQGLATSVLILLGILLTLIEFGLPASSIFAGSALLGLAISFGAQSLVKDLVNGCLILLEDQFAVGDIIVVDGEGGLVEKLNLRLTQLRNADGELISVPNSSISRVKNQTSSWARVNLGIDVAYSTDLDEAIALIEETATQMSQEAKWRSLILEPPQVLGVDTFGENSITLRLWMRTDPLQKLPVGRELRHRLKKAFDKAGISMPFPQRSVWFKNTLSMLHTDENQQ